MKKIITLALTLIMAFTFVLSLVPSVYAEAPVATVDVKLYLWSEDVASFTYPNVDYGQPFNVNTDVLEEGQRFVAWVVDGVRSNAPASTTFVATSDMKLELIYVPEGEFAAVFVDTNGHVIDVVYVDDATPVVEPVSLPDKPGFILATPAWDQALGLIEADTFYKIRYQLDESTQFSIGVVGGSASNDEPTYNDIVTLTPADPENFVAWLEGGQVVSFDPNYKFSALSDRDFEASEDELLLETTLVILHDVTGIRDGYHSFIGYIYLPDGYELVEAGLLLSDEEEAVVYDTADYVLKSSAFHPTTGEFLRSIEDENMTEFVRAYAIVRDTEDNLSIVYSFIDEEDGEEIPEGFIGISSEQEFHDAIKGLNGFSLSGKYFLTKNLDFASFEGWNTINATFSGEFDGNNKIISNIEISQNAVYGIFVRTGANAVIKNLTINKSSVTSTNNLAGLLIGQVDGNTVVSNITIIDSGVQGSQNNGVGLIAGRTNNVTLSVSNIQIINSTAKNQQKNVGGIVGRVDGNTTTISDVYVYKLRTESDNTKNDTGAGLLIGYIVGGKSSVVNMNRIVVLDSNVMKGTTQAVIGYYNGASTVTLSNVLIQATFAAATRSGFAWHNDTSPTAIDFSTVFVELNNVTVPGSNYRMFNLDPTNEVVVSTLDNIWWETNLPSIYNSPFFAHLFEE